MSRPKADKLYFSSHGSWARKEETRRHLGVETQRQWADKSIARTTPILMGLYSLITLMALELRKKMTLILNSMAWYSKNEQATFSDVISLVRRAIWLKKYLSKSNDTPDSIKLENATLHSLIDQVLMAA